MIQAPEGAGKIELTGNEVNITLASTGYLQAQAGADLMVNVIEGQGEVEVQGVCAGYLTDPSTIVEAGN